MNIYFFDDDKTQRKQAFLPCKNANTPVNMKRSHSSSVHGSSVLSVILCNISSSKNQVTNKTI